MTALPKAAYLDPCVALIRREERTCKGCKHADLAAIRFKSERISATYCKKKPKAKPMRGDGKRCADYTETGA